MHGLWSPATCTTHIKTGVIYIKWLKKMLVFKKAVFLGVPGGARDYGRVREGLTTNRGVAKPRNIIVVI